MNFRKLLHDLEQVPDDVADEYVAGIVNLVSQWASANGHADLVRDWTPAASRLEARRYLAEAIAVTKTQEDGTITPSQVAKRLGVRSERVLAWIKSGKLKASNLGTKRPRYRVTQDDLSTFLKEQQTPPKIPRAKRRSRPSRF
jgi:excisionase family DNA binding protein